MNRKSPSHINQPGNISSSPSARQKSWFPLTFNMGINEEGELIVQSPSQTAKSEQEEEDEEQQQQQQQQEEVLSQGSVQRMYGLHAVLCQIDDGTQKNLVSLINVRQKYHAMKATTSETSEEAQSQWYIFNDFR